ncbi:MAG: glycosyltransferase [Candidatus Staskawiczbacteria bacterium]|jgi:processive 1,2-diacylglycerol beta-glucosyltransferase
MEKKKVLILYAPLGEGHGSAAKAIVEAFALKYPEIEVKNIDILDFVFDIFKHSLPWVYNQTTIKTPTLYKWIYDYYNYRLRHKYLNQVSSVILKKSRLVKFIEEYNPDLIISTNPLAMQLVSLTKKKNIINILSANVCTDFGFHALWSNEDVNYYFVANNEIKESLIKHGVNKEIIKITGIPISQKFNKNINREKIISDLNFDNSGPILLIVGGRIHYRDLVKIINGLKSKNNKIQFIIVAGRDKILQEKLENSEIKKESYVKVFNFIDNIEDYMVAADLVLTKAGGLTVSECLAKSLPMVFNDIIPGQEEDNVKFVVKHVAGVKAGSAKKSIDAINKLLLNSQKLLEMKQNCQKIAKPKAAEDLVDIIISKT